MYASRKASNHEERYVSTDPKRETSNAASSRGCCAVLMDDVAVIVVFGRMRVGVGTEPLISFCARAASDSWANPIAGGSEARNTE